MTEFLLSLDEVEWVKRRNRINNGIAGLSEKTDVTRNTWSRALKTRKPTPAVLDALATLGARPDRILVADDITTAA